MPDTVVSGADYVCYVTQLIQKIVIFFDYPASVRSAQCRSMFANPRLVHKVTQMMYIGEV